MPGPQALCRPNRDLRWRPETPPYRPYLSLTFRSPDAARNAAVSFYISVGPARVTIIGGLTHRPDAMARERVREAIAADPEAFATLLRDRSLRARFGGLWGGAYRRAHEGLRPGDPHFVLLARSTWCLRRERPAGDATRPGFTRRVLGDFQALAPVVRFLAEALQDLH